MSDSKKQQTQTKTYTLLSGRHLSGEKTYHKGDTIELTEDQAVRFEPGRLQMVSKATKTSSENENSVKEGGPFHVAALLDQPPIKAITDINALTDIDTLKATKTAEESGQKRAGVIKAITSRIEELSKSQSPGGGAK